MTAAVTLSIPGLFGPLQDLAQPGFDFATPGFDWLLSRGRQETDYPEASSAPHSLAECGYFFDRGSWPDHPVLLAEPVHLRADQRHVRAYGSELLSLSQSEADQLTAALNELVEADGLRFEACRPDRWYLHLDFRHEVRFSSLTDVLGKALDHYLPSGNDSAKWHGWLNEWQMLLFNHPVNRSRTAKRQLAANGIWVWGEQPGYWPVLEDNSRVVSDAAGLLGCARAQGHAVMPLAERFTADLLQANSNLFLGLNQLMRPLAYQDTEQWLASLQSLDENWVQPVVEAFRKRHVGRVNLLSKNASERHRFVLDRRSSWQFWRKQRPLHSWFYHD